VLTKLRASHPDLPVIVLTAKGGIDSAVEGDARRRQRFPRQAREPERIAVSIRNQLKIGALSGEVTRLKKKTDNRLTFEDLVAKSSAMRQVFPPGRARRAIEHPDPHRRRERRRQGIDRARDPMARRARAV